MGPDSNEAGVWILISPLEISKLEPLTMLIKLEIEMLLW
jgi:hypothetical protein